MKKAYDYPKYYEIALSSLRDVKREVEFIDKAAKRYSKCKVRSVMEIGCGNSPYVEELSKKGYSFVGLDLNQEMLNFSKTKAKEKGISIETIRANMLDFRLKKKVDLCFVLFGSIYRKNNDEFIQHLNCVSDSLKQGGIYVMHMVVEGDVREIEGTFIDYSQRDGIKVKVKYEKRVIDISKQLLQETLTLFVNDNGNKFTLSEPNIYNFILPQEFKLLVDRTEFELVDWFDGFRIHKKFDGLKRCEYVVCVLRKK